MHTILHSPALEECENRGCVVNNRRMLVVDRSLVQCTLGFFYLNNVSQQDYWRRATDPLLQQDSPYLSGCNHERSVESKEESQHKNKKWVEKHHLPDELIHSARNLKCVGRINQNT